MRRLLIACLLASAIAPPASAQQTPATNSDSEKGLAERTREERGGRHWIDAPTPLPLTPLDSLAAFETEPGIIVELVAAEPLVRDPVWIAFDHHGRMFVAEYGDYPIGPTDAEGNPLPDAEPLSRIVMLTDRDHDGRMDERVVFADGLDFCHSFLPLNDGILAATQHRLIFLQDTDGDNVCDLRQTWFEGFEPAHPQMQIGCPQWGPDNCVWLTYAPGEIRCVRPGFESNEPVRLPRGDMKFDPRTMEFESVSGTGQFGNTFDAFGRRYFCTNRNPIITDVLPVSLRARSADVPVNRLQSDVGPSGGETRVFPLVEMRSNWLSHAGTHTAACAVTADIGGIRASDFGLSLFVSEPVGHVVTRTIIQSNASSPIPEARRAREGADFLASRDPWFRPAGMCSGPDGSLYLADMYRSSVEHPKFLPPDVAARVNWRAGADRGRIWRIRPDHDSLFRPGRTFSASELTGTDTDQYRPPEIDSDLLQMLTSRIGWRRTTAQRLIAERGETELTDSIRKMLETRLAPEAAVSVLSAINALGELTHSDIAAVSETAAESPELRQFLLKLRIGLPGSDLSRFSSVALDESHAAVRLQILGAEPTPNAVQTLALLAVRDGSSPWFRDAVAASANECAGHVLETAAGITDPESVRYRSTLGEDRRLDRDMAELLGLVCARSGDDWQMAACLRSIEQLAEIRPDSALGILSGVARGLPKARMTEYRSLAQLLKQPPPGSEQAAAAAAALLQDLDAVIADTESTAAARAAAFQLLLLHQPDAAATAVQILLNSSVEAELQLTAVEAVIRRNNAELQSLLFDRWRSLRPQAAAAAIDGLVTRTDSAERLLNAMARQQVDASAVSIDQRMRLLEHRDEGLRKLAAELFGASVSADREAVAATYQAALTTAGHPTKGAAVFRKVCSRCHQFRGEGHRVGPDISDTVNRSAEALLYDILDPNRRVDPFFAEYVVVTEDGRSYNGIPVSESDAQITLRQPEGREQSVQRTQIEEFRPTGRSLMPVGVEKEISVTQMADLLAFLRQPRETSTESDAAHGDASP